MNNFERALSLITNRVSAKQSAPPISPSHARIAMSFINQILNCDGSEEANHSKMQSWIKTASDEQITTRFSMFKKSISSDRHFAAFSSAAPMSERVKKIVALFHEALKQEHANKV